ncbi:sugar transporter, putative [Talaromyces stipitatus ATCC 10500]|uniref:Sugar transporter, putative n=1 Tax=Talaromyces stipitatus (strain ATCC 10500 / CBS 375.48 / QM 6759 / NRRL 1006) TaxID=441959 RepID=B8MBI8_TALSN|nr:sugar transporter, putative [Talaromyces stipitatus ATCC 10500]EED17852.1 sugar transporter, putative [Talaromyces stipitatus ATCC 10500]
MALLLFAKRSHILSHFTPRLAAAVSLIALSSLNYGFDNQGIATSQAMATYKHQFGTYNPKTGSYAIPTYWTSLLNSLNFIGFAFGLYIGSIISARYGRRMSMFCMCVWATMSATVLVTSRQIEQVLAGRILNYTYIGMELSTCPPFQAEIVPAPIRGFAVGTYQTSLLLGGIIINSVCRGTSGLTTNAAWRIPQTLFYIIPTVVGIGVWLIPESPRWLLLQGRERDALESLRLLRTTASRDDDYDCEHELYLLKKSLLEEQNQGTYRDLFRGSNLRRTFIAMGMNFFIQATGSPFTAAYGTLFVQSLNSMNAFDYSIMSSCINTFCCLVSTMITDKVGRRPILLIGSALQITWLFSMAGIGLSDNPTSSGKHAIIALTALSSASLCFSWDPLNYIITTELPASRLRDKTQRVASSVNIATNFAFSFSTPYLLDAPYANLGSKVGFIFGSLAIASFIFAYFCVPEMKGRTLEEIDGMFQNGVPVWKFGKYRGSFEMGASEMAVTVEEEDAVYQEMHVGK